jgi:hypothetical protein
MRIKGCGSKTRPGLNSSVAKHDGLDTTIYFAFLKALYRKYVGRPIYLTTRVMPILSSLDGGIRSLQLQYTFRILRHSQAHDSEYAQGLLVLHTSCAGDSLTGAFIRSAHSWLAWQDAFRTFGWGRAIGDLEVRKKEVAGLLALVL